MINTVEKITMFIFKGLKMLVLLLKVYLKVEKKKLTIKIQMATKYNQ